MNKKKTPAAKVRTAQASRAVAEAEQEERRLADKAWTSPDTRPLSNEPDIREFQRQTRFAQRFAENVLNSVRDPLLALNSDLTLVWASRSFHQLFDTAQADVVGKSLFELAGGQWDIPELRRHLGRILPDQMPIEAFSLSIEVPGKGKRDLLLNAHTLANEHVVMDLILVALQDVTDQKLARLGLRDREARLHAILNAVPEAIVTIDTKGIVTSYSPPSALVLGYTQTEVMGRNVSMLMPEPHRHKHDGYISAYLATGQAKVIGTGRELEALHKSGKPVPMHLSVTEVEIGGERQFLGVICDLTEEKESRNQLEQAQKMEAVGRLAGGIAHDFNNLLTVIIGNIELLEMRPDDPNRDAILAEAMEAANLGAALVARLLLFSKRQTLAPEELALNRAIEDFMPLLRRALGAQIEIRTELDDDLDLVVADQAQVGNAVLNLSINARDAMPRGGGLTIRTQNAEIPGNDVTDGQAVLRPGNYVVLSVSDTGSGMTPEVMDHLFEPFFSTKEPGNGTGLGLPMIHRWVRQSGGDLMVESEPGKGTVVSLYLPAIKAQGDMPPRAAPALHGAVRKGKGETVLLVEDDPRVRNLTRQRLERLGYAVVEATDGPTALTRLEGRDDIGLMLSDVVMPGGIDGFELADKVHALYPELRILLATGFAPGTEQVLWPVLRKPYGIDVLSNALRGLLDDPS